MHLNCRCHDSSDGYVGALSDFLLAPLDEAVLARANGDREYDTYGQQSYEYSHNRSVVLSGCDKLRLALDFGALPGGGGGATFRLEVCYNYIPVSHLLFCVLFRSATRRGCTWTTPDWRSTRSTCCD